ncbi:MAG: translation initiation factor IF-2, partial [Crocinitomicaceae bacterium]|nr:translation initiation factor IF-2 [Crocinitomicaceae bacterium]
MIRMSKRLNKAAKEYNVSIATIVEYLGTKNIKIDSNPNTKIEDDVLAVLDEKFAEDKTAKQASENVSIAREKRESLSLKDIKKEKKSEEPEEEEEEAPKPKRTKTAEKKVVEPEPVEKVKQEVEKPKVAVVGKIDLDTLNQKTRPDKKKKAAEEKVEEPVVKKEVEVPQDVKPVVPEPIETIKAKTEKLTGPTVVGKIVLPVAKEKSAESLSEADKKKRKRIKKVNIEKQAAATDVSRKGGGNKNKQRTDKPQVTEEEIQKEIKETLARLQGGGGKSKGSKLRREKRELFAQKREAELEREEQEKGILKLTEFVTVSELASMMSVSVNEVIAACMSLGIFASINQRLDAETIQIVAAEYGFETQFISAEVQEAIKEDVDDPKDLVERPPIVTVMGHVDHGKTSLLDYIRSANVISGEAGGITQHIGAYSVVTSSGRHITFLDTPGHEAFTAMRARGAQVTDIAIIIVAADDDVMPQTKEAISHAQAAGVPMVFAINKIDKPGADPERIKQQLSQLNILVEDWGGKFQSQEISAKKGTNVDALLEKVLLEADILELKANPNKNAVGTVVEASLDKGRGYVTTLLVSAGTLRVGDFIVAGQHYGRVKAMHNERGQILKEAGPSTPVSILGFTGAPSAGDKFNVLSDEREAKQIATKREQLHREQGLRTQKHITLDEIGRRIAIGDFQELNVIVKGDVDGSIEALSDSLLKLSTPKIQINIIHKGVGAISETDVTLASASNA